MMMQRRRARGFTIMELLVVLGIIMVLMGLLIPSGARAREMGRRVQCMANLRSMTIAAIAYANDDPHTVLIWKSSDSEDSFRQLYPRYMNDLKLAVCPSTLNVVTKPDHLKNNAKNAKDESGGHSYEIRTMIDAGITWPDGHKFSPDPVTGQNMAPKRLRQFKNPARVIVLSDADDRDEGDSNNYPDPSDNHGEHGFNFSYMDGHAEWVPTGRPVLEAWINGYYHPSVPSDIMSRYGLQKSGSTYKWVN